MIYETKTKWNFGIVGCGMIAEVHAKALNSLKDACLIGVADATPTRAAAFAEKFQVRAFESFEQMLADETIDAVCICTPSGFHAEQAITALSAGKHVAVEKPLAMTVQDADAVIETAKKSGKLLTVISQLRFSEDVNRLKTAVESGDLGKLRLCDLTMKYWRDMSYYQSSHWKGSRMLDGGVLMNQGIHGIDLLRYIVGNATVIGSVTDRLCHKIEAPDTALALVRYDCGALGTITASTAAYPGFDLKLSIIGENGYAEFREDRLEALVIGGSEKKSCADVASQGTASDPKAVGFEKHALQLQNFIDAMSGRSTLAVRGEDGRAAVSLIAAIYQE